MPSPHLRRGRFLVAVIVTAGAVASALACVDTTRMMTASAPRRGLSAADSAQQRILRPGARASSLIAAGDACDPATTACPSVVGADPGYFLGFDQPSPITFTFAGPVRTVSVTGDGAISCSGNVGTLTGYGTTGVALGHVDLELIDPGDCSPESNPDNVTFGAHGTLETRQVMAYAILTPPSLLEFPVFDLVGHASQSFSVEVGPGTPPSLAIAIVKAEGPNEKSFTFDPAERKITLKAEVTPADAGAAVTWEVVDAPGDNVSAIPPTQAPTGLETSFPLPKHDRSRWPTDHPGAIDRKTLRYKVTALAATEGSEPVRSEPVIVSQDLVDTIREEYYEFGLTVLGRHIPGRGEFAASPPVSVGANNGDYQLAVLEPKFMKKLADLQSAWFGRWQLNTIYRNPNHNLNGHIRSESKPSLVSWHMWGCAADLQTFPADRSPEQYEFWHELRNLAEEVGFETEGLDQSKLGHVHVELDCP